MTRNTLAGLILILSAVPAFAAEDDFWVIGMGRRSCAHWQSSAETLNEGKVWIYGFWSGMNVFNTSHTVGSKTDPAGIIGEVKKFCENAPSESLFDAASMAFLAMDRSYAARPQR
jgi:hypothetical protein